MDNAQLKVFLIEALENTDALGYQHADLKRLFLAGTSDIAIENLSMDSLAAMELCIAFELELGVSMAPTQLLAMGSLSRLLIHLEQEIS